VGVVLVWNATTGHVLATMQTRGAILSLAFRPDGRHLALAGEEKTVKVCKVLFWLESLKLRIGGLGVSPLGSSPGVLPFLTLDPEQLPNSLGQKGK
jgi:hypothetical protein